MANQSLTAPSDQNESEITLGLLTAVDQNEEITQRSLARDLGIALGLANTYIKRCAKKGLIKVSQAPANRYAYYLTPKGFAEKSRLTAEYLSQSLSLFRVSRDEFSELLTGCAHRGWSRILVSGANELVEILSLCARDLPIEIVGILDENRGDQSYFGIPVLHELESAPPYDAVILTEFGDPQAAYERLVARISDERLIVPRFMNVSRRAGKD